MADVSHELGSLRHIVDTPLSSKVAMFNKQANQHQQNQLLNPFSGDSGRRSPKPSFSKDEYGKPLAGSLTEARGQKANIHVLREMLELCQIIDSEGYVVKDEPTMRVIPFGELFNIYNYISDKVVGICLRARKHKLIEFEGEMLFQRRDDDVPIFLLKPIAEIRKILNDKTDEIKRGVSPAPQATSVLIDKRSRSASPHVGKTEPKKDETAKVPEIKEAPAKIDVALPKVEEVPAKVEVAAAKIVAAPTKVETTPAKTEQAPVKVEAAPSKVEVAPVKVELPAVEVVPPTVEVTVPEESKVDEAVVLEKSSSTEVTVSNVESTEVKPVETEIPTEPKVEPPPIVITEEATEKPIASESSCSVDVESKNESNSNEDQESFVSASSSIVEISEEIVVPAEKIDENNNDTSKNEGPNDNSVPV